MRPLILLALLMRRNAVFALRSPFYGAIGAAMQATLPDHVTCRLGGYDLRVIGVATRIVSTEAAIRKFKRRRPKDAPFAAIGPPLENLRLQRGISQVQLAEAMGMGQS